jgi:hypothetical protein
MKNETLKKRLVRGAKIQQTKSCSKNYTVKAQQIFWGKSHLM